MSFLTDKVKLLGVGGVMAVFAGMANAEPGKPQTAASSQDMAVCVEDATTNFFLEGGEGAKGAEDRFSTAIGGCARRYKGADLSVQDLDAIRERAAQRAKRELACRADGC